MILSSEAIKHTPPPKGTLSRLTAGYADEEAHGALIIVWGFFYGAQERVEFGY